MSGALTPSVRDAPHPEPTRSLAVAYAWAASPYRRLVF
jgi:hypothetical protein